VSNAIKFTERGIVTVHAYQHDQRLEIEVRDTGIGIKNDDLDRLFQPFHQLDTGLARRHDGTGLGLSICKRLVELMGGSIRAHSAPGVGSVFSFTLGG
jgi:signal transduction histidine kinase